MGYSGMKNRNFGPVCRFISEMIRDRATVTTECVYETALKLSNGTIFNDLERHLTRISRSCYYLTLSISETI